jgi:hypothetical protein
MSTLSPSVLLFRMLILASVATGMLGGALDALIPELRPEGIVRALRDVPQAEVEVAVSVRLLSFVGFVIQLTAAVGLFMFKPWARGFALGITVANLLFYPLYEVQTRSNWSRLLLDVSTTLWGAVLATSYVSSLARHFKFDFDERDDD